MNGRSGRSTSRGTTPRVQEEPEEQLTLDQRLKRSKAATAAFATLSLQAVEGCDVVETHAGQTPGKGVGISVESTEKVQWVGMSPQL